MNYERTFNFSAGPAMMPEPVLEEIRDEMMNYRGSGMCVMEMSHRSKVFEEIRDNAEKDLRELMGIPDNYKVLFVQGGGTGPRRRSQKQRNTARSKSSLPPRTRTIPTFRTVPIWLSRKTPATSTSVRTRPSTAPHSSICRTRRARSWSATSPRCSSPVPAMSASTV